MICFALFVLGCLLVWPLAVVVGSYDPRHPPRAPRVKRSRRFMYYPVRA